MLKNRHSLEWEEVVSLFYFKFYPPSEIHKDYNSIYNFWPLEGESIAQAWGRLKTLILKCPNHELPDNIIVNNFYARLSGHCKDYLDSCSEGSFTSKKIEARWDLLERIQNNAEYWENDKGKESGINYEYDCIKSFVETAGFQELSVDLIFILVLIVLEPSFLILMFLKKTGTCIMNLSKTLAWKMKLLLMIAINMLKLLKILFLISMLIFVECIDLAELIKLKMNIVSIIGMKILEVGIKF